MQIILLERIKKLGFIGDVVDVKNGYARNFLLPKQKALRLTKPNLEYFKTEKAKIEANNLKLKTDAEKVASKMSDVSTVLVRNASDSGFLYGAVRPGDIVVALAEQGYDISKSQVKIAAPIKAVGNYKIEIALHPEVSLELPLRIMTTQEQIAPTEEDSPPSDA